MSTRAIQERLKSLGFDPGGVDGIEGPSTQRALIAYAKYQLGGGLYAPKFADGIDPRAIALIKEFEGFRAQAYKDAVGVLTIGFGTTKAADVGIDPQIGMVISEAEAEMFLRRAVDKFAAMIEPMITQPITAAEFGAFLSLAYNIGPAAFARSSALRHFNAGDKPAAAQAILAWNKAGGKVLPGLVRRRAAERDLFLS